MVDDREAAEEDHALEEALKQAELFKSEGNAAFKQGNHVDAIRFYSQAIGLDPENAIYYSNRSAAYLAEGDSRGKALKDAEKCIELKPDWAKGYSRKAAAEHALGRYEKAKSTYFQALDRDPDNAAIQEAIETVRKAGEEHSRMLRDKYKEEERRKKELEEAKAKAEAEAKAAEENKVLSAEELKEQQEQELLASFMNDIQELSEKPNKKDEEVVTTVDFGSAAEQVNRLLQPNLHYPFHHTLEWIEENDAQPFSIPIHASFVFGSSSLYRVFSNLESSTAFSRRRLSSKSKASISLYSIN